MRKLIGTILVGAAILTVLWGIVWWEMFKWSECRHVGHSWLYCFATQSK